MMFLDKEEQLLNQALSACKNCQNKLTKFQMTIEKMGQDCEQNQLTESQMAMARELAEELKTARDEFNSSYDAFKDAFWNVFTGGK